MPIVDTTLLANPNRLCIYKALDVSYRKIKSLLIVRLTQGNMSPSVRDYECVICVSWGGVFVSSVCLYC